MTRVQRRAVGEEQFHLVGVRCDLLDVAPLAHVDTGPAGDRYQRGVEVAPGDHRGVDAAVVGERQRHPASGR